MASAKFQTCLRAKLTRDWGLDVFKSFPVQLYNQAVQIEHPQWVLPTFGREHTLAMVVGNTKLMWDRLRDHVADQGPTENPVDSYVERGLEAATQAALEECGLKGVERCQRFSHGVGSNFVHMQLATTVSGLAYLNPICHLNIHAEYGPWLSLRSVLVFDLDVEPMEDARATLTNPHLEGDAMLKKTFEELIAPDFKATWKDWLRLRDVAGDFSPAHTHRFSDEQLAYHYTQAMHYLLKK
eukprot:m.65661 g.65661  ORF g.65661 m.65661 type:complete len:240 (+) comp23585_c0_seq2:239-958(+)